MLRKIAIILAVIATATNALAAATVKTGPLLSTDLAAWATANIKFTPSKSVIMGYQSGLPATDATGTNPSVYSIGSKNSAGDSLFGATSASTSIVFSKSSAGYDLKGTDLPTLPTDPTDSSISGGAGNWSVL